MNPPSWWLHSAQSWAQLNATLNELTPYLVGHRALHCIAAQGNWHKLNGGVSNQSYRLTLEETELFVQIPSPSTLKKLPGGRFYPVNQRVQRHTPLTPWLAHCYFESDVLRIFQWINIAPSSADNLFATQNLSQLVEFLKTLHQGGLKLPALDLPAHLNHYYQINADHKPHLKTKFKSVLKDALALAADFTLSVACHNDLSAGNLLFNDRLYVVDWEYACQSDPLFELAVICENFKFSDAQQNTLLSEYDNALDINSNIDKFSNMKALYRLLCLLWEG